MAVDLFGNVACALDTFLDSKVTAVTHAHNHNNLYLFPAGRIERKRTRTLVGVVGPHER